MDTQPCIKLIDDLRGLGIERDIEGGIPQIAVMGDQSSGKSSVHLFPSSRLAFLSLGTPLHGFRPATWFLPVPEVQMRGLKLLGDCRRFWSR